MINGTYLAPFSHHGLNNVRGHVPKVLIAVIWESNHIVIQTYSARIMSAPSLVIVLTSSPQCTHRSPPSPT